MYKIKDVNSAEKGSNIGLDFNEEGEHVWIRSRSDRAGEMRLQFHDLEKIAEQGSVIIGYREEGRAKKIKIGTGGFRDIMVQVKRRAEVWGADIFIWGARPRVIIDIDDQEKEIETQQEEKSFMAAGCLIFGFTKEIITTLGTDEIVMIAMERAKQGIKGGLQMRRGEIKKRIEGEKGGYITANSIGVDGVKNEKMGVIVEFVSDMLVGKVEGHGVSVYDWGKAKKEGTRGTNISLSRQMMTANEMSMLIRASIKKQDYAIAMARRQLKSSVLDDMMRRSFQGFLENELGIKVLVWMMSIRHNDDNGRPRDEGIMVGLVSETGGKKLGEGLKIFQQGSKKNNGANGRNGCSNFQGYQGHLEHNKTDDGGKGGQNN